MFKAFDKIRAFIDTHHQHLASARSDWLLALLGLVVGIFVGCIVIVFRLLVEWAQAGFLPGADPENYELLGWQARLVLPLAGSAALALVFYFFVKTPLRLGVIHVMERLAYHEGHLPLKPALLQFFGGAVAIISGHSVGREGPSIHLGAAGASVLGQKLRLPNNSIRSLVACGAAAAIAASFNTPLAGVIFAMEVVMMEYSITGFIPVILAAVSATTLNRIVFENLPTFIVPQLSLGSFWELLLIVVMGVVIGALATGFIRLVNWVTRRGQAWPLPLRMLGGGLGVAMCAIGVPQVMGIGYDTVNAAIFGNVMVVTLLLVLAVKLLATAISIGMGIPGGLIGPTLFMGALAGSASGQLIHLFSSEASHPGLYALLGMGAMMGATLQAPLAALLALLELTGNVDIIFPGMLAIVSANLAARELFKEESVYLRQMQWIGLDYHHDPLSQSLRRRAVGSVMDSSFVLVPTRIKRDQAEKLLAEFQPQWLIIDREAGKRLMPAADLARVLDAEPDAAGAAQEKDEEEIELMEIPSHRRELAPVRQQSTLQQAYRMLNEGEADALYVVRPLAAVPERIYGIVTREHIEQSYQLPRSRAL